MVTGGGGAVPFEVHVELLHRLMSRRDDIVDGVEALLNAQRRPAQYLQDHALRSRDFESTLFARAALGAEQARFQEQLRQAHWASGFRPREMPGLHNDLVDPGQMMVRAFHLWERTRWPGRNARLRYGHTLFDLYVLRSLELLVMRIWDAGADSAGGRLTQVQQTLDALWASLPAEQPVLLRDARWLVPLALSPTTDELSGYFDVLEHIEGSLRAADRLEIHKAAVQMAGGHLRSQLRHYLMARHVSLEETALLLTSRNSNALDFAMLIQGLVPLLEAYGRACLAGDEPGRLELAGVICQGVSADPELFVNRIDLLGPYTMIENLFVTTDPDAPPAYSPMGRRHVRLLQDYAALLERVAAQLHADCSRFRPVAGHYSPYGLIYGFSSNLTEHIALKTLQTPTATSFSLEDAFSEGGADKLGWVNGWRKLPHIDADVQRLFDYPQSFAEDIFARVERALRGRLFGGEPQAPARTGRIFLAQSSGAAPLEARHISSSDAQLVASGQAQECDPTRLLRDRREGMFVVSYPTTGGWVAISKDILSAELGAGRDLWIPGLPAAAGAVLQLTCPGLVSASH